MTILAFDRLGQAITEGCQVICDGPCVQPQFRGDVGRVMPPDAQVVIMNAMLHGPFLRLDDGMTVSARSVRVLKEPPATGSWDDVRRQVGWSPTKETSDV